jgi:hypothetical protein
MSQTCQGSLQLCFLRISSLLNCIPDSGSNKAYVSNSAISLNLTLDVETGEEFTQKNGCGSLCIDVKDCDRLKGITWDMELCSIDHELMSLMIGATLINVGGQNIGHLSPDQDTCAPPIVLEWWTKRVGKGNCQTTTSLPWWHWAIPFNEANIGKSMNFQNGITNFMVSGYGRENPAIGVGPFSDWPVPLNSRLYGVWAEATPPVAACSLIALP